MSYSDPEVQRAAVREAVARHRAKVKGITGITSKVLHKGIADRVLHQPVKTNSSQVNVGRQLPALGSIYREEAILPIPSKPEPVRKAEEWIKKRMVATPGQVEPIKVKSAGNELTYSKNPWGDRKPKEDKGVIQRSKDKGLMFSKQAQLAGRGYTR